MFSEQVVTDHSCEGGFICHIETQIR